MHSDSLITTWPVRRHTTQEYRQQPQEVAAAVREHPHDITEQIYCFFIESRNVLHIAGTSYISETTSIVACWADSVLSFLESPSA